MARKTADVDSIKASANKALNDPDTLRFQDEHHGVSGAVAYREGIAAVLESVLFDTGNYAGFRWTDGEYGRDDHSKRFYF